MWRRQGKRKDGGADHTSDETPGGKPPPFKKSFNTVSGNTAAVADADSDTIPICEISNSRKVSVRLWQGKIWVDIREFYVKDGNQLPGKKGISLSLDQFYTLRDHVKEIDEAVAENS